MGQYTSHYLLVQNQRNLLTSIDVRVLDRLNDHMGAGTLRYAAEGFTKRWRAKFERRSPAYTTNWLDLPIARAS